MNANTLVFTTSGWEEDVLKAGGVVLVDFWASWCPPCRALAPAIDALAEEMAGKAKIGKLNVDDHPEVANRYGIRSIPTLLVFRDGQLVDRAVGALPRPELSALVSAHLETPAAL